VTVFCHWEKPLAHLRNLDQAPDPFSKTPDLSRTILYVH